ncbi:MAG TPA: hypothetical protein VMY35_00155 [Phycisphaerae bacterium]|nr:hypothetical protein [Phycisphaerae bacterium]
MAWVVQRYITLAGGGTLFDPDPAVVQPGATALDGNGIEIPMVTAISGQAWADVIVVDDAGDPQPVGAELFDVGFAKRTLSSIRAAEGTAGTNKFSWNRGELNTVPPGIEQTQPAMETPSSVVFVVVGGSTVPASGRLAVRVWEAPR